MRRSGTDEQSQRSNDAAPQIIRAIVGGIATLLLLQSLAFSPQFPAPPEFLGHVHPLVLITIAALTLDLSHQLYSLHHGKRRRASYLAFGTPVALTLILLQIASAKGGFAGWNLTFIDARGRHMPLGIAALTCFFILSLIPLFGPQRHVGKWASLTALAAVTGIALSKLSHALFSPGVPAPFLAAFSTSEALLFLGLAALSMPLTSARRLVDRRDTPVVNRTLWIGLSTCAIYLLSSPLLHGWTRVDMFLFVLAGVTMTFVAERYLRPLESPAGQTLQSILPTAPNLTSVPTQGSRNFQEASTSGATTIPKHAYILRLHHWASFHANLFQRGLLASVVLACVALLSQALFSWISPDLPAIWPATATLAYFLTLHRQHDRLAMLAAGIVTLCAAHLMMGSPLGPALFFSISNGICALVIAKIAIFTLKIRRDGRHIIHMSSHPQDISIFVLASLCICSLFTYADYTLITALAPPPGLPPFKHLWLAHSAGFSLAVPLILGLIWRLHFEPPVAEVHHTPLWPVVILLAVLAFALIQYPIDLHDHAPTPALIMGLGILLLPLMLPTPAATGTASLLTSTAVLLGTATESAAFHVDILLLVSLASILISIIGAYKFQRSRARLLYREILEDGPAMTVTMDDRFHITSASHRFCDYVCLPRDTLIGLTPYEAGFLRIPNAALRNMQDFIRKTPDRDFTLEIDIRRPDGQLRKALAAIHKSSTVGTQFHYLAQITDTTALHRNSRLYKLTLEEGPALLLVQDAKRITLDVAPALCRLLEFSRTELIGKDAIELTTTETRKFVENARAQGDSVAQPSDKVLEVRTKSGSILKVKAECRIIDPLAQGNEPKYVILFTDVTELEAHRSLTETLLNRNAAIVLSQDRNWRIQSASDAWCSHFGYSRDETIGRDLNDFMPEDDRATSTTFRTQVLSKVRDSKPRTNTLTLHTKNGDKRIVELRSVIEQQDGRWLNIVMVIDITDISLARQKLEHLVAHDDLTGLLSRRGFNTFYADGQRPCDFDLFMIDVDHFKSVNDAYGHETGDDLLRLIAQVLEIKTQPLGCACRIGGEEFAVIRPAIGHAPDRAFAEELMKAISTTTLQTASGPITRTVSIGVTRMNRTDRLEEAIKWSDWALRDAKEDGRNRVVVADDAFTEKLRDIGKLTNHQDIIEALKKDEIKKYVQPIFDSSSSEIVGFEALMRWERADGTLVVPRQFMPQLRHVLLHENYADVPRHMRNALLSGLTACPGAFISFNTRLESLAFRGAAQSILKSFGDFGTHRHNIVIELCEDTITDRVDMDQVIMEIAILRSHGIRIALDDFGKEASNLNRLTHLPIDIVKIDKSLIDRIVTDRRSREALRSIIQLADALDFEIIAEGVETHAQRNILLSMGLHLHQGFLYARPMSVSQANDLYVIKSPPALQAAEP
ncbi:EAL domain-containing protein [Celeribacter sp.]|uniref:EAL domain-containing protein n=1 Tax=Celeribacter sp. TaxID=1890673 RepID=UPI003A94F5B4